MTSKSFPDRDWRVLRNVLPRAIDRSCERVLREVQLTIADTHVGAHQRYLAIMKLFRERDESLGRAFDNITKSTAMLRLVALRMHGFLSDGEFAQFSQETRAAIQRLKTEFERST